MNKIILNQLSSEIYSANRLNDIRKYGHQAMSYSALQEGINEFRHPSFEGFIAYTNIWGVNYVLSNPITDEKDYLKATKLFLQSNREAVFCQISKSYAEVLSALNFKINSFGVEHFIDLKKFHVSWNHRKCLKSWMSKLSRQEYYVFESIPNLEEVHQVNQEWLHKKQHSKELKFMARPFASVQEPDVRYFYLIKNKKILGFCSFDPVYSPSNNQMIDSYVLQHLRVADDAPLGSQDYLILNSVFQMKDEGFKKVSLGLAPLVDRKNDYFNFSQWAEAVFKIFYRFNICYRYQTMGEHKNHYKADKVQTYIATNQGFSVRKLCGLLKVNNLI